MCKFLICFLSLSIASISFAYEPGEAYGQGKFLYSEPVEGIYSNNWHGVALNDGNGQAVVYINGEGKTVDFYGILSVNCENSNSYWISAKNFEVEDSSVVPQKVVMGAAFLFCK